MGLSCSKANGAGAPTGAGVSAANQQIQAVPTSSNHNGRKYTPATSANDNSRVVNLNPVVTTNLKDDFETIAAKYPGETAVGLQRTVEEMRARLLFYPNIAPAAKTQAEDIIKGFQELADEAKKEERTAELETIIAVAKAKNSPMTEELAEQMAELSILHGYTDEELDRHLDNYQSQAGQSHGSSGSAL